MDVSVGDGVVGVKHLARPRAFDGSTTGEKSSREWKFGFENNTMLVDSGFVAEMTAAEESPDPILRQERVWAINRDVTLYAVTASWTTGRASRVVQGVTDRHGYEACDF